MLLESKSEPTLAADPWTLYLYTMRSPATKERYLMRLGKFLEFLGLQGTLEDKAKFFAEKGKYDSAWAFNSILKFLQAQKKRLDLKKERKVSKDTFRELKEEKLEAGGKKQK